MKFNKMAINELRDMLEDKLTNVETKEEKRIQFDKELLEVLIFDTYKLDDGLTVKVPVWTGDFLSKLDLSEVSFDNVSWDDSIVSDHFHNNKVNYAIDFGNTNAKIDFSKAYWEKDKLKKLCNCNFMGLDLRSSNTDIIELFTGCNFSHALIYIYSSTHLLEKFNNCDLFGVNLSPIIIDNATDMLNLLNECNIRGTGINFDGIDFLGYELKIRRALSSGDLVGCYINGVKMLTNGEKQKIKNEQIAEYKQLQEKTKKYILDTIAEYKKNN